VVHHILIQNKIDGSCPWVCYTTLPGSHQLWDSASSCQVQVLQDRESTYVSTKFYEAK